ncbi:MAG: ComEC/Rec2 family competence protein [Clostridia bacterium]|nr:ComEC/Rec2 family competence protein [Clostridia bacterium]
MAFYKKNKVNNVYAYENKKATIVGEIIDKNDSSYKKKYTVKILSINNGKEYKNYKLIYYSDRVYSIGNIIKLRCNIEQPDVARNYHGFNNRKTLLSKRILGTVNNATVGAIDFRNKDYALILKNKIKTYISEVFYKYLPQKNASVCETLIFGTKMNLDQEIIEDFNESSLSYILAISGMHVSFIVSVVVILVSFAKKSHSYFIVILFICLFACIVDGAESVLRACIMMIIFYLSKIFHAKSDSITSLAVAILIMLIDNPFCIFSSGFEMSVIGTLSIIFFYSALNKKSKKYNSFFKYVLSQIYLSLSANILLMPIIIEKYNRFSIFFIISGTIASAVLALVIPIIIVFLLSNPISITFTKIISKALVVLTNLLLQVSEIFSNISWGRVYIGSIPMWSIVLYYLICSIILVKVKSNANDKKILNKLIKGFVVLYLILAIVNVSYTKIRRGLNIFFIDVGQGDATLIVTPQNKKILIDGRW